MEKEQRNIWSYFKIILKKEIYWHILFYILTIFYTIHSGYYGYQQYLQAGLGGTRGAVVEGLATAGGMLGLYLGIMLIRTLKLKNKIEA